jgi:lipopolysaccharide export system protein LptC
MTDSTSTHATPPTTAILRRRLKRVRTLRWALPGVAALLVAAVGGQLIWTAVQAAVQRPAAAADSSVRMVQPTFSGEGRDGSHYRVTAQSGVRDAKDDKLILLDKPIVVVTRNGQPGTQTVSERGVFHEDDRSLKLEGDVRVQNANGYRFVAQNATIDTSTGQVVGQAIQGRGIAGEVQSNSYAVSEKGDRVIFKGGVRARLNDH